MGSAFGSKGGKSSGKGKNGFPQGGNGGNIQPAKGLGFDNQDGKRGLANTQLQHDKKGLGGAELQSDPTLNKGNPRSDILPKNNVKRNELITLNIDSQANKIQNGAFANTPNLQGSIQGAENVDTVGDFSFFMSGAIDIALLISGNMKHIGDGAFLRSGLKGTINIEGNIESIGRIAFSRTDVSKLEIGGNENLIIQGGAFLGMDKLRAVRSEIPASAYVGEDHFSKKARTVANVLVVDTTDAGQGFLDAEYQPAQNKWYVNLETGVQYEYVRQDIGADRYPTLGDLPTAGEIASVPNPPLYDEGDQVIVEDPLTGYKWLGGAWVSQGEGIPYRGYLATLSATWDSTIGWVIVSDHADNTHYVDEAFIHDYGGSKPSSLEYSNPSANKVYQSDALGGSVKISIPNDFSVLERGYEGASLFVRPEDFADYENDAWRRRTGFDGQIYEIAGGG